MASVAQCEQAFATLAGRLAKASGAGAESGRDFDRTLSCTLTDLGVAFGGQLADGQLLQIRPVDAATAGAAKVRMTMTSDDLVALVDGTLNVASAWATGRVRIEAGVLDLLKLRSLFAG